MVRPQPSLGREPHFPPRTRSSPPWQTPVNVPLAVDLDGTLILTDLLQESALKLIKLHPACVFVLPRWLAGGKARLKREIADRVSLDVAALPFNGQVLEMVRAARAEGHRVVLCTAADARLATAVADHLGLFDEVLASDGVTNLSAANKAAALVARFGERGFDYVGNAMCDVAVWSRSREAIVVAAPRKVVAAARAVATVRQEMPRSNSGMKTWIAALRLQQWVKNLLLLLPLLASHEFGDPSLLLAVAVAFVAFSLCASSVYIVNDLMDLESDRHHPRKQSRPFAAGRLSPAAGLAMAALLLTASFALSLVLPPLFMLCLAIYLGLTLSYTLLLKQKVLVDSLCLAGLYTLRVIAGGAAAGVDPGFWLLAFSLFLFLSLAFVKRYSELSILLSKGRHRAHGRGYVSKDLPLIETLGIVSGYASVLVMALYLNGESIVRLYPQPLLMWFTVPILLYWISRIWVKAHRGEMHDDPVLFALTDRLSLITIALFIGVLTASSFNW